MRGAASVLAVASATVITAIAATATLRTILCDPLVGVGCQVPRFCKLRRLHAMRYAVLVLVSCWLWRSQLPLWHC